MTSGALVDSIWTHRERERLGDRWGREGDSLRIHTVGERRPSWDQGPGGGGSLYYIPGLVLTL